MRLFVTGGNGMVGSYVHRVFNDWTIRSTDIDTLDVRDTPEIRRQLEDFKPDVMLHLAAYTDVDWCESNTDQAFLVNATATGEIARACGEMGIKLVYVSTAGVFDGEKPTPYLETDHPNPVNVYGDAKWLGEEYVRRYCERRYIVRAGWMFGGGEKDKKFVGKIMQQIREGKKELLAVTDKIGSPTYALDLVRGIRKILEHGWFGLYHMANSSWCSRYEVAQQIKFAMNAQDVLVRMCESDKFPLPAKRAKSEALHTIHGKFTQRLWVEALTEYVTQTKAVGI